MQQMMENGFLQKIQNIIGRVSNHSKSLIYFVGGKQINFSGAQLYASRAKFAVLQHNTQREHYHLQKNLITSSPVTAITKIKINRQKKLKLPD